MTPLLKAIHDLHNIILQLSPEKERKLFSTHAASVQIHELGKILAHIVKPNVRMLLPTLLIQVCKID